MAGSSLISRAGTPSRRPTGSSALTAGAGRRSNPNASWPARTAALSSPSISPGCASPCRRMGQPSSARAMAPAKAAAPPPARCTTSRSRLPRPTPPSGRWPPSAGHLVLSSIGAARPSTSHGTPDAPALAVYHRHPFPMPSRCSRVGFHPDDTTPIPRPSHYYGRRHQNPIARHFRDERRQAEQAIGTNPRERPCRRLRRLRLAAQSELAPGRIDKSVLTIAEPKRLRDKAHLRFVASQPCLVCGRQPCDPHHLRFAQPRAIGLKVSDEFTVPLCRGHHRQLHQAGNEVAWWENLKIKPLEIARGLWEQTHPKSAATR